MKTNITKAILGTAAALLLTGCNDFLTVSPEDKLVTENYYTSAEMIRANTAALYSHYEWKNYAMNLSGRSGTLLPLSPLRTVRESFPSYGSSNSMLLFLHKSRLIILCF